MARGALELNGRKPFYLLPIFGPDSSVDRDTTPEEPVPEEVIIENHCINIVNPVSIISLIQ